MCGHDYTGGVKRFTRTWIVVAALAFVVTVCALALIYRPANYKFLQGADSDDPIQVRTSGSASAFGPVVLQKYAVGGPINAVMADARLELAAADGWTWEVLSKDVAACTRTADRTSIQFYADSNKSRPQTYVRIYRPETPLDRFLAWIRSL